MSYTKKENNILTKEEVRALFKKWNAALATGDSRVVAARYIKNPVLLPTVSDRPRTDFEGVKDYFDSFLLKKPRGKILNGSIYIGEGWAADYGIYQFTLAATGDVVKARYSFNYVLVDGEWKIQHHHSSQMPEEMAGKPISEDGVRGLFSLWNNALATLDPKKVAARYAKGGVLLPTVSDTPRTDPAGIADYFVKFLKGHPQGEILESHVTIGTNWCQDVGLYEFTMGVTGKKVKGRYTFVYTLDGGEWKIKHHHSSMMPEGTIPQPIEEQEVKDLFQLWNSALATLDPDTVAKRYASKSVLLPTLSDTPRASYNSIKDYFVSFLKKKPQGTILESHVTIGFNWCQDVGVYEFKMGTTGDKVKGRYSFVYVWEDGQWMINHHHSSMMPENP